MQIDAFGPLLPLLYINSGGIPEYCDGFGTMFNDKKDFEDKLSECIKSYETISQNIKHYPYSSEIMSEDFLNLFKKMVKNKEDYLDKRIITLNNSFISRKLYFFKK